MRVGWAEHRRGRSVRIDLGGSGYAGWMTHVVPARYVRGTHGNAGNAVRYRDRQRAGTVKLIAIRLTEHGRACVRDTSGATWSGHRKGRQDECTTQSEPRAPASGFSGATPGSVKPRAYARGSDRCRRFRHSPSARRLNRFYGASLRPLDLHLTF